MSVNSRSICKKDGIRHDINACEYCVMLDIKDSVSQYIHNYPNTFFKHKRGFAVVFISRKDEILKSSTWKTFTDIINGEVKIGKRTVKIDNMEKFSIEYNIQDVDNEILTFICTPVETYMVSINIDWYYSFNIDKSINQVLCYYENIIEEIPNNKKYYIHVIFRKKELCLADCKIIYDSKTKIKGILPSESKKVIQELTHAFKLKDNKDNRDNNTYIVLLQDISSGFVRAIII